MIVAPHDNSDLSVTDLVPAIAAQALLVEPRILRRVIRLDRRIPGLGFAVPHAMAHVIERARLLAYVELEELGLPPTTELPRRVILLARTADEDATSVMIDEHNLARYRRLLFHSLIHLELETRFETVVSPEAAARQRWQAIGRLEGEEIRSVLLKDGLLFPEASELETYIEFAAVYLELRYFAPSHLAWYFPAVRDWPLVNHVIDQDLDHLQFFQSTQLGLTPSLNPAGNLAEPAVRQTPPLAAPQIDSTQWRVRSRYLPIRAQRASAMGNGVKAAILRTMQAAQRGPLASGDEPESALRELRQVVARLQPALHLSSAEVAEWTVALRPLLIPAASAIWSVEARLLYDLQKACVEHERGVFKLDLFAWCRALGKHPLRRALPLLREVLITKHLRSASRRISSARLQPPEREQLLALVAKASKQAEEQVRQSLRPRVLRILDQVGLGPQNVPERTAQHAVAEELLDSIVEQGVANLGHLRDTISRNDIKLPDLAGAAELFHGDALLSADRLLANELAGIYRPGAIYLRSTQRLSSLAFGTRTGRFLTSYVAIPFGSAFLALEGLRHLFGPGGKDTVQSVETTDVAAVHVPATGSTQTAAILALGSLILLLMHSPPFRCWFLEKARQLWSVVRGVVVELPQRVVYSERVQAFLRSAMFGALRSYLIWPGIVTVLARTVARGTEHPLNFHPSVELFLATALFLNSRIGRYLDERIGDLLLRVWHELRMRVFAAIFEWIMDTFQRVLAYLERLVYTVDEWLRFRAGDNRTMAALKLLTGTCWFFISYVVILVFTLLIEPQINPIKHFPIVTVSHKLLLTAVPSIVKQLAPLIGATRANTLVWSTIWLIPGVFGFLVWELKGNWRLYEANRPDKLVPTQLGHHGETMVRMLRAGFHSGTLPKLFGSMRQALTELQESGDRKPFERKYTALRRVEEAVHRFVDRRLLKLWEDAGLAEQLPAEIEKIHLATSQIEVTLRFNHRADQMLRLRWEEHQGTLVARVWTGEWLQTIDPALRNALGVALSGLLELSCAETIDSSRALPIPPPLTWTAWVAHWS